MKKTLTMLAFMTMASIGAIAQPKLNKDNIEDVLKAMTLEEKASLLVGKSRFVIMNGVPTGTTSKVEGAAGETRAIERLGIPGTVLSDGPAGVRISPTRKGDDNTYYATAFPVGTVLASTWDAELVQRVTKAMGEEAKDFGIDVLLAPGMNIQRNPLCGRNFEYFSEDPFLSGKMAAAYTKGIQENGIGVSIKHFMGNNQETNRNEVDSRISQRALREIYLKNFEIAVKDADPWTVMSSYNKMNGKYTQQNRELLPTLLRDEWGFKGLVMTDWGNKEGTVDAVNAGNDLMEPGSDVEVERILAGVRNGVISEEQLNTNVRRMLEYIVKTPSFANYHFSSKPDLKAHAQLTRESSAQGMVLLKNDDNTLPLKGNETVALYGVTSYDFIAGGAGSGQVNTAYIRSLKDGLENDGLKVDETTADWYSKYVAYATAASKNNEVGGLFWGKTVLPEMQVSSKFITKREPVTDLAVITIGRNAGEGTDRKNVEGDFSLTQTERQLLQDVADTYHAAGKKVIVVLNIGGVIETESWKSIPDAILLAWQPGEEGGASVADILVGKVNPSGKLAVTFPVRLFDNPSTKNFPFNYERPQRIGPGSFKKAPVKNVDYTNYEEGIYVGYRYFETKGLDVSYPFGYGLSYTTFEYSSPVVKATSDGFVAMVTVKNAGKTAGREAVQIYVTAPSGGLDKPSCELKGFVKTKELLPGESQTVSVKIDNYSLASFNENASRWETADGVYQVKFAASVRDVMQTAKYQLKKPLVWEVNDILALKEK